METPEKDVHGRLRELIDTLWNVNEVPTAYSTYLQEELIDTLWNVNLIINLEKL